MTGRERAVTIRFPPELLEMLKRIAERDKRSLNSEVVYVLRQFAEQRQEQREQAKDGE